MNAKRGSFSKPNIWLISEIVRVVLQKRNEMGETFRAGALGRIIDRAVYASKRSIAVGAIERQIIREIQSPEIRALRATNFLDGVKRRRGQERWLREARKIAT